MKCAGDKNHRGIKIVLAPQGSNHYANVHCKECGAWIQNVDARQMEIVMGNYGVETAEASETEPERMKRCFDEAMMIEIETFGCRPEPSYRDRVALIAFKLYDGREK